jgi:TRAP-type C4-dicarboxylate transport system substrate-binding protein
MIRSRTSFVRTAAMALVVVAVAACSSGSATQPVASGQVSVASPSSDLTAEGASLVLRLATPEAKNAPSQSSLDTFVSEVARASGGSMSVDVTYSAGGADSDREQQVAGRLIAGDVDMAVLPVRTWPDAGVTSLQALGAPFLIDNDALLNAVTTDDALVQPLLDGMQEQGLVGLAAWPEGLRHPFTFEGNGSPLVSPDDFKGQKIAAIPNKSQREVIETLGATVVDINHLDAALTDGSLRGAEAGLLALGLPNEPTSTADVTLYPKVQVIAIEDAAWGRLSPEQQAVVKAGALAARDHAVEVAPSNADLATAYCAKGGNVVLAGAANIAKFAAAAKPIYDRLESDPTTATALDAIRALKKSTPPSVPAKACRPSVSADATYPPVVPGPAIGPIPDGSYHLPPLTEEDLVAQGVDAANAHNNAGTWSMVVAGSSVATTLMQTSGKVITCFFTMTDKGDRIRIEENLDCRAGNAPTPQFYWTDFRWNLDGDQLTMKAVDEWTGKLKEIVAYDAMWGGPWTKVE